ncbi:DUF3455 domain-containing protein [Actinoplanes sp. NBC_00393]|uniref:DUF3455 domain-containing protein n=1 Tax=Actinoplanes sp. NBC_00393 TaxID=2975953 RepID=UPI002E1FF1EE
MLSTTRSRIRALAAVGLAVAATAVLTVSTAGSAAAQTTPLIPDIIQPPAGSKLVGAYVVTKGTQTYTCVVPAGATTGAYTGASVPEAKLFGTGGWLHHFGGPSWQSVSDGSLVTAARVEGSPRPGTIPELLLKVTTRTGNGVLSRSDYINRLRTSGGVAPTGTCTTGQTASVAYGSVYVFWDAPGV